jgi:hypothetical protein
MLVLLVVLRSIEMPLERNKGPRGEQTLQAYPEKLYRIINASEHKYEWYLALWTHSKYRFNVTLMYCSSLRSYEMTEGVHQNKSN